MPELVLQSVKITIVSQSESHCIVCVLLGFLLIETALEYSLFNSSYPRRNTIEITIELEELSTPDMYICRAIEQEQISTLEIFI